MESNSNGSSNMSAAQLRKIKKPIIERRRRERINDSLNQLKALVLDAMQKDESRYSKMEKADILEMTVKHLKLVQRQRMVTSENSDVVANKYRAGFSECANEVSRYLANVEGVNSDVRVRVMRHLGGRHSTITPVTYSRHPMNASPPSATPLCKLPGLPRSHTSTPGTLTPPVSPPLSDSPVAMPAGTVPMGPARAQQPFSSVIPLYVNTGSPIGVTTMNTPILDCRRYSQSPLEGDIVPEYEQKYIQSQTVLATSRSCGPASHVKHECLVSKSSVWRPW